MDAQSAEFGPSQIGTLLRGEPGPIVAWTQRWAIRPLAVHLVIILAGAGCYGAAMGWWRAPQQALFTAIKFPLIMLLTVLGTALLNAMLAPLLGLNIPFRQSFLAIVMSFSIAAAILGSFSPIVTCMVWNAPPMSAGGESAAMTYSVIQLTHVAVIAFAGIAANYRLIQLLRELSHDAKIAWRVFFAWLAANLFFGSQLSWILRPFIGHPGLEIQFLRPNAFEGNFYETVFRSFLHLLTD